MNMHKNTRLMPYHREEIGRLYHKENMKVSQLAIRFHVIRPTIYKTLKLACLKLLMKALKYAAIRSGSTNT